MSDVLTDGELREVYEAAWRLGGRSGLYAAVLANGRWARPCPACRGKTVRNTAPRGKPVSLRDCDICCARGKVGLELARVGVAAEQAVTDVTSRDQLVSKLEARAEFEQMKLRRRRGW